MCVIESLWHEKQEFLQAIARNVAADPASAEDILQEAITRMLESHRDFEETNGAFRFLIRVITNLAIDNQRNLRRQRRLSARGESRHAVVHILHRGRTRLRDFDPLRLLVGVEREILLSSLLNEIRFAMQSLPHKQKEAIHLMFFQDEVTLKVACSEKGIPYSTLRSRMLRGVDQIRGRLRKRGFLTDNASGSPRD